MSMLQAIPIDRPEIDDRVEGIPAQITQGYQDEVLEHLSLSY